MKKSLTAKAEAARNRVHRAGKAQARSARSPLELREAARSRMLARATKPDLKLDDLRVMAAAARKQLRRG